MRNIIIDPGIIPVHYVKEAVTNSEYNVYFIQIESRENRIKEEWGEVEKYPFLHYYDYKKYIEPKHPEEVAEHYNRVYNAILSDYRTMQISERVVFRVRPWQNDFNDLITIGNQVANFLDIIIDLKPAFVFYHSTPHDISSWILGKVAETMGIPVYMTQLSILPWKALLVKGIDEHDRVSVEQPKDTRRPDLVKRYYEMNIKRYDEAITPYEKECLEARKGKFWSWREELREAYRSPHRLVAVFRKYVLYKCYKSLSQSILETGGYVAVFLHFQPERTSLPEGGFYVQQLHLIRTLHLACPSTKILVKEHPSMFTGHLDIRYRNKEFYRTIAAMDNVELVDIATDTFEMIDHATYVATIKGTVGAQALLRGKPTLIFGESAPCNGLEGCYLIKNVQDVLNAIEDIKKKQNNAEKTPADIIFQQMMEVDEMSISGIEENEPVNDLYSEKYSLQAAGNVLKSIC